MSTVLPAIYVSSNIHSIHRRNHTLLRHSGRAAKKRFLTNKPGNSPVLLDGGQCSKISKQSAFANISFHILCGTDILKILWPNPLSLHGRNMCDMLWMLIESEPIHPIVNYPSEILKGMIPVPTATLWCRIVEPVHFSHALAPYIRHHLRTQQRELLHQSLAELPVQAQSLEASHLPCSNRLLPQSLVS